MNLAPIVIFCFNRVGHLKETIDSLKKNYLAELSDLIIYSDGYKDNINNKKKVLEVRKYLKSINGFKSISIINRNENFGLSNNIITGVSEVVNKYNKIIVLEDDLITSPYFLTYMNEGLNYYENIDEVISIHGYVYPIPKNNLLPETFFLKGADCWGWATWKRGWDLFEQNGIKLYNSIFGKKLNYRFNFNNSENYLKMLENQIKGKNNSWAIRWYASAFINHKLTLYPKKSLVFYNGSDRTGENSHKTNIFNIELTYKKINIYQIDLIENDLAFNYFIKFFKKKNNIIRKIFIFLKNLY